MRPLRTPIMMSVFDLLKAGPGPSSSHTIGPIRAGADFATRIQKLDVERIARIAGVRVRLFGALSATGKGHGTDRAVLAGLMGYDPERCPPALLQDILSLPAEERILAVGDKHLCIGPENIEYGPVQHTYPYSNTLLIDLLDRPFPPVVRKANPDNPGTEDDSVLRTGEQAGVCRHSATRDAAQNEDAYARHVLFSREYYSVGGGFLQWKGWKPEKRGAPPYPYVNMGELQVRLAESGLSLDRLLMINESAITGASEASINARLDTLLTLMTDAAIRGCQSNGLLPGLIGLPRKAGVLYSRAASLSSFDRLLCLLNAYAYGAAEENAAGSLIVTAPTCGAAGVMPAATLFMREHLGITQEARRKGLLASVAIGFIAKQNAGIAGAEVGCQGEVGVASAMAAAMLTQARGCSPRQVENAAEIALEHHLGLTCDPVGGYVQIPCIERNAVGAVTAYNASLIAANEDPAAHLVRYDDVLLAMAEIGRNMSSKYKETSTGGLAACLVVC